MRKLSNKTEPIRGSITIFDAACFIIDEIEGKEAVVGHYVLTKEGSKLKHYIPPVRIELGQAACLDGVKIRTRFKIKYQGTDED